MLLNISNFLQINTRRPIELNGGKGITGTDMDLWGRSMPLVPSLCLSLPVRARPQTSNKTKTSTAIQPKDAHSWCACPKAPGFDAGS